MRMAILAKDHEQAQVLVEKRVTIIKAATEEWISLNWTTRTGSAAPSTATTLCKRMLRVAVALRPRGRQ
jgi:hypothetical protein